MSCRQDAGESWDQKELRIIEEIELVGDTKEEAIVAFMGVLRLSRAVRSEIRILGNKEVLSTALFKLASTSDDQDPGREERLQDMKRGIQKISDKLKGFQGKLNVASHQLKKEAEQWGEFLLEDFKSFDELKGMKAEDRKELLEKNATFLSLIISGKEWFENFQDEWDDVKSELDESILGYMKKLVVIAKEPVEPSGVRILEQGGAVAPGHHFPLLNWATLFFKKLGRLSIFGYKKV